MGEFNIGEIGRWRKCLWRNRRRKRKGGGGRVKELKKHAFVLVSMAIFARIKNFSLSPQIFFFFLLFLNMD